MSSSLLCKQCASRVPAPRTSRPRPAVSRQLVKVLAYREVQQEEPEIAEPRSGFQVIVDLLLQRAASRVDRGAATCLNCKGEGEVVCRACKGKGINPNMSDPRSMRPSLMKRKLNEVKEMLGAEPLEINWKVTNRCLPCKGTGQCRCSVCQGTGQRVPFPVEKAVASEVVRQ